MIRSGAILHVLATFTFSLFILTMPFTTGSSRPAFALLVDSALYPPRDPTKAAGTEEHKEHSPDWDACPQ